MAEEYKIKLTADTKAATGDVKETASEIKDASKEQGIFASQTALVSGAFKKLKGGVRAVITTFKTLKGAIAATGIGLLVIALGSLVLFFTKTQRGADALSSVMAGVGAAVDVVVDRISGFGESIMKFFSGDFKGAVEGMTKTFAGMGDEIVREAKLAVDLKNQLNDLVGLERDFNVQKARNNVLIRQAEVAAYDESIALSERVKIMQEAMDVTMSQAEEEERLAKIRFKAVSAQVGLGESMNDDLDKKAAAETALINIQAEKARTEKRLITVLKTLKAGAAKEEEEQNAIRLREEEGLQVAIVLNAKTANELIVEDAQNTSIKLIDTRKKQNEELLKSEKELTADEILLRKSNTLSQLQAGAQLAGALSSLAGDNKELAVASAIISTFAGANKAFEQGGVAGFLTGAAVIAAGLANVRTIMQTEIPNSSRGSSQSIPTGGSIGSSIGQAVPVNANLNDLINQGNDTQPVQAYVISQEVTDSQEAQQYINNQTRL